MPTTRLMAATPAVLQPRRTIRTIYVDLGFGQSGGKNCGFRATDGANREGLMMTSCDFGELTDLVGEFSGDEEDILLVLEAPLSTRFDENRNPCPRDIERRFGKPHDPAQYSWHRPIGHGLLGAARILLERLVADRGGPRIHLAEGFISGKGDRAYKAAEKRAGKKAGDEGRTSNPHTRDTIMMQEIHAGKIGQVDGSRSPGLRGCVSILARLTGERIPPPVLCLKPSR